MTGFSGQERDELRELPAQAWEPVVWRKARVHRDWHIQIDTIKYSVPYEFAGLGVDVRIVGQQLDVLVAGEVIATHHKGQHKNGYVTHPEHAPAYLEETTGLWTRAYFLRQAAKAGPATVAALERLLDSKKIEAQGFRSCMNILDLGKRGKRQLLEEACKHVIENDTRRPVSYTAIKHAITAIRAAEDQRPTLKPREAGGDGFAHGSREKVMSRDTSRAHLAGPAAFSLEALTGTRNSNKEVDNV